VEVPVFVQLVSKKGKVSRSYWQDGGRFDETYTSEDMRLKTPNWARKVVPAPQADTVGSKPLVVKSEPSGETDKEKGWISKAEPTVSMPDCKWAGQKVVATLTGSIVQINDLKYNVDIVAGEVDLREDLKRCLEFRAMRRYKKWRDAAKRSSQSARVTTTDFNALVRAFKQAADEISADLYRDGFLRVMNAPR
jgi:hypothetical protein